MPKNYCNRTLIVKVIIENVVTCFLGHSVLHNILIDSHMVCLNVLELYHHYAISASGARVL